MKNETNNRIREELIKFVMETANGIDAYNWGQEKFEKELRDKIAELLKSQREQLVEKIKARKPTCEDDVISIIKEDK